MNQIITSVGPKFIDAAFEQVAVTDIPELSLGGSRLYKMQGSPVETAVKESWEKIQTFLKETSRLGWEAVREKYDGLCRFIETSADELQELGESYRDMLLEKLRQLMQKMVDMLMKSVNAKIQIGDITYVLNSIDLQIKLSYSASVEASLTTVGKFLGTGEMTVTGKYGLPAATIVSPG